MSACTNFKQSQYSPKLYNINLNLLEVNVTSSKSCLRTFPFCDNVQVHCTFNPLCLQLTLFYSSLLFFKKCKASV